MATSEIRRLSHRSTKHWSGCWKRRIRRFCRTSVSRILCEKNRSAGDSAGCVFRMLLIGYLEGIGSERGIAWRCADSISLREFLGYGLAKNPPDHSTVSRTRRRLSLEAHEAVFGWVLERLRSSGLLSGKTLGVDSTTLEAQRGAAFDRAPGRRDGVTRTGWRELAKASGIESADALGVGEAGP